MGDYYDEKLKRSGWSYKACFWAFIAAFVMALCLFFTSCSTKQSVETDIQYHHLTELTNRMDSMFHSTSTWQQSLFEKQTALVDSFKQSEVRDTSHTVFLGEKGDTVKEIINITKIIEREHTSSESTKELREEFFKQTDSLFRSNKELQAKMDSLLHSRNKETVVEKKAPWYERWLNWILSAVVLAMLGYILYLRVFVKRK